jgi:hypothetical protein
MRSSTLVAVLGLALVGEETLGYIVVLCSSVAHFEHVLHVFGAYHQQLWGMCPTSAAV